MDNFVFESHGVFQHGLTYTTLLFAESITTTKIQCCCDGKRRNKCKIQTIFINLEFFSNFLFNYSISKHLIFQSTLP
jgi:hypothetical protein